MAMFLLFQIVDVEVEKSGKRNGTSVYTSCHTRVTRNLATIEENHHEYLNSEWAPKGMCVSEFKTLLASRHAYAFDVLPQHF